MTRVLCTFPGRAGDLLWALPTVRAVSAHYGVPVDLQIAGEFQGMVPLLAQQSYLRTITADARWGMDGSPAPPLAAAKAGVADLEMVPEDWDRIYHLQYRGWPDCALPFYVYSMLISQWQEGGPIPTLDDEDLARPWITPPPIAQPLAYQREVAFGWTDCHFELKYGLTELIFPDINELHMVCNARGIFPPGSRWITEGHYLPCNWLEAAQWIASARVFLTDCSALHVLAVALGKPVVIMEPMKARWNPIFYPLGMDGRVRVVKGLDGQPTFDARHTTETLEAVLRGR